MNDKNNKGFTLIELIVVIAILGILTAIALPMLLGFVDQSKIVADQASVKNLNDVTPIFRTYVSGSDPFEDETKSNEELLQALVNAGYFASASKPQTKDASYSWSFDNQRWYFLLENSYIISSSDGISIISSYGRLQGSYTGSAPDILIPSVIDGFTVKYIYQDVFNGKNLIAVTFAENSEIIRIHARAFSNNQLAEIAFPKGLERIDLWAFRNNNLTEITLPSTVQIIEQRAFDGNSLTKITIGNNISSIGNKAFGTNTEEFISAYNNGGAGTYIFVNGNWVKQ